MDTLNNKDTTDEEMATLVDEVMRGERLLLFPPGTLISSFFVPALSIGAVSLSFMVSAYQFPLQGGLQDHQGLMSLVIPLALALILMAAGSIGFIFIIKGHSEFRSRLFWYVRGLIFCALIFMIFAIANLIEVPLTMCIISVIALTVSHYILASWSFLCFSSFFSLKREYRENTKKARIKVLGHRKP